MSRKNKYVLYLMIIALVIVSPVAFAATKATRITPTPTVTATPTPVPVTKKAFSGEDVLKMGINLADKIEELGRTLPKDVEIAGNQISIEDTMYLMAKWLELYGESGQQQGVIPDKVDSLHIDRPAKFGEGVVEGTITWSNLYKAGKDVVGLLEKSSKLFEGIPVMVSVGEATSEAVISADVLIYVFARSLRWVADNNQMPNYASIRIVVPPKY